MCMRIRLSQLRQIIREELRMRDLRHSMNEAGYEEGFPVVEADVPYPGFVPGPRLQQLIDAEQAWLSDDGSEYVGRASDGTIVGFGTSPEGIEKYLQTNPTPDTW